MDEGLEKQAREWFERGPRIDHTLEEIKTDLDLAWKLITLVQIR
jgi:hypothetical protein